MKKPAVIYSPHQHREQELWKQGCTHVAGIDEAGRGPLAGPVVAAAVIFPPGTSIQGLNDSKKLSHEQRESLFPKIYAEALAIGIGIIHADIIDDINILNATFRAMEQAVDMLDVSPQHLLVDGNRFYPSTTPYTTIVAGDTLCYSIAAASIIAKVTRDRMMHEFDEQYPGYGFARHKGYGTRAHYDALRELGMCPIHRRSFVHLEIEVEQEQ
ncbi:MAG TPA: ribonuclease HII [Candidatus Kapabacteria bacterium]|nr:ribonuclease HII [Candidatus Kapabacteria bacterium]